MTLFSLSNPHFYIPIHFLSNKFNPLMLILFEKIVGHSPLCPSADSESLSAHEVEEAPVEEPPPPLGAVGGLEDGRDHGAVLVHLLEPGVECPLVVCPAHPPVILDLQVRLEVEQQRMRWHGPSCKHCQIFFFRL